MVEIDDLPGETTDDTITPNWREPESNGKVIIMYSVYQRVVTDGKVGQWTEIRRIASSVLRFLFVVDLFSVCFLELFFSSLLTLAFTRYSPFYFSLFLFSIAFFLFWRPF